MDLDTAGFALAAGMVAAVNPCGFAMLPAYLALVVTGDGAEERTRSVAVLRAFVATAAMAVGFLTVFGVFGLVVAPLASSVQEYLPAVTVVIGVLLVALGGWMLTGREVTVLLPKPGKGAPTGRLVSMIGYGFAYAIASLSCTIAPFLAVTSTTFQSGSVLGGVAAYLAYGAGMTLVVGVLAVAVALANTAIAGGIKRALPHVTRIGGGLLIVVGLYVGYYGVYELRLFHGDGSAADPIVDAAGAVQSVLAGWVDAVGPIPLVITLAVLVSAAVVLGRARSRSRRR